MEVQKLFDEIQWDSTNYENKISVEDIQLFLDEYAKEIWIQQLLSCDNKVEYTYHSDKNNYLKL